MKSNPLKHKLDLQLFAEDPAIQEEQVDPEKNYAEAIKKLKETTVSKESYEKLEAQNKQLLDAIINGGSENTQEPSKPLPPDLDKLRKELFNQDCKLNNLEFAKKSLELRKGIMEQGGIDPFVPVGEKIIPEQSDFDTAKRVADILQECIDASEGDSGVFTNLLQLRTIEVMPNIKGKQAKA